MPSVVDDPEPYRPPKFDAADKQGLVAYLEKHGYAVVSAVASPAEVEVGKRLQWDFLESLPGSTVSRDDISTWEGADWIPDKKNGIINNYGIGQSDFMSGLLPLLWL